MRVGLQNPIEIIEQSIVPPHYFSTIFIYCSINMEPTLMKQNVDSCSNNTFQFIMFLISFHLSLASSLWWLDSYNIHQQKQLRDYETIWYTLYHFFFYHQLSDWSHVVLQFLLLWTPLSWVSTMSRLLKNLLKVS